MGPNRIDRTRRAAAVLVLAGLAGGTGCFRRMAGKDDHLYEWPRVVVTDFRNTDKTLALPNLRPGSGLRTAIVRRLAAGGRIVPVEPVPTAASQPRSQGAPTRVGRSPRYRVRGVVQQFRHERCPVPWRRRLLTTQTESERARMCLQLVVEDIRTGQVVLDHQCHAQAEAWPGAAQSAYTGLQFDSPSFRRTPLGQCVQDVTAQAVKLLEARLVSEPWVPEIVRIEPEHVVIDGGLDRLIRVGWHYDVLDNPAHGPGQVVGVVQVVAMRDDHCLARAIRGGPFRPGMRLRRNTQVGLAR